MINYPVMIINKNFVQSSTECIITLHLCLICYQVGKLLIVSYKATSDDTNAARNRRRKQIAFCDDNLSMTECSKFRMINCVPDTLSACFRVCRRKIRAFCPFRRAGTQETQESSDLRYKVLIYTVSD